MCVTHFGKWFPIFFAICRFIGVNLFLIFVFCDFLLVNRFIVITLVYYTDLIAFCQFK